MQLETLRCWKKASNLGENKPIPPPNEKFRGGGFPRGKLKIRGAIPPPLEKNPPRSRGGKLFTEKWLKNVL